MNKHFIPCFALAALLLFPYGTGESRVTEQKMSGLNYAMSYPEVILEDNRKAQERINKDLSRVTSGFYKDFKKGKFFEGRFSYKVRFEDDRYLSLTVADYRFQAGAAHGYTMTRGYTYDKTTGRRLPLRHFVKICPSDKRLVLQQPIYNVQDKRVPLNETFATDLAGYRMIKVTDNYCLNAKGNPVLIYPPYELACYAMGTLYIHLSPEMIDYFNRKNQ